MDKKVKKIYHKKLKKAKKDKMNLIYSNLKNESNNSKK